MWSFLLLPKTQIKQPPDHLRSYLITMAHANSYQYLRSLSCKKIKNHCINIASKVMGRWNLMKRSLHSSLGLEGGNALLIY